MFPPTLIAPAMVTIITILNVEAVHSPPWTATTNAPTIHLLNTPSIGLALLIATRPTVNLLGAPPTCSKEATTDIRRTTSTTKPQRRLAIPLVHHLQSVRFILALTATIRELRLAVRPVLIKTRLFSHVARESVGPGRDTEETEFSWSIM